MFGVVVRSPYLVLVGNARGEQLEPLDDARYGVVLALGLALLLDVVVAQRLEQLRHLLDDGQEEGAHRVRAQHLIAQAPRLEERGDHRYGELGRRRRGGEALEQQLEAIQLAEIVDKVDKPAVRCLERRASVGFLSCCATNKNIFVVVVGVLVASVRRFVLFVASSLVVFVVVVIVIVIVLVVVVVFFDFFFLFLFFFFFFFFFVLVVVI